jgi:hypothetical protein
MAVGSDRVMLIHLRWRLTSAHGWPDSAPHGSRFDASRATKSHIARRSRSTWLSQLASWLQLVKMRLANAKSLILND